jgi:4-hydroxybenzoate polyprenyltransferase
VAGTLSATPVGLAAVAHEGALECSPLVALGVFLLGRWWVNVTLFDVRDESGDRARGLRTVPVVLGRTRTVRLLEGVNVLLAGLALAVPLLGWAPPAFALLGLSCLYAGAYLRRVEGSADLHFLCDVVSDGELLVLASAVLLLTRLLAG